MFLPDFQAQELKRPQFEKGFCALWQIGMKEGFQQGDAGAGAEGMEKETQLCPRQGHSNMETLDELEGEPVLIK